MHRLDDHGLAGGPAGDPTHRTGRAVRTGIGPTIRTMLRSAPQAVEVAAWIREHAPSDG